MYVILDLVEDYNTPQWQQLHQDRTWGEYDLIKHIQSGDQSAKVELAVHKKENSILRIMAREVNYLWG